eukprot:tig00000786_g4054.t1
MRRGVSRRPGAASDILDSYSGVPDDEASRHSWSRGSRLAPTPASVEDDHGAAGGAGRSSRSGTAAITFMPLATVNGAPGDLDLAGGDRLPLLPSGGLGSSDPLPAAIASAGISSSAPAKSGSGGPAAGAGSEAGPGASADAAAAAKNLVEAAKAGDLATVRRLLDRGAAVDAPAAAKQESGFTWTVTALCAASRAGHEDVARLLLDRGAAVDARDSNGQTALYNAAEKGHEAVVRLLLERGAAVDARAEGIRDTVLHRAVMNDQAGAARLLLERGAELDSRAEYDSTPLHYAAGNGSENCARLLLERGAPVDAADEFGRRPLHRAAETGHLGIARCAAKRARSEELLLDRGAAVDARTSGKWTPLFDAVSWGHEAVCRLLLERGAAVDSRDEDALTALHLAAKKGRLEIARLLLERGAEVDPRESNEMTPLHHAAAGGHEAIARLLLEQGAALDSRDREGRTPLHAAIQKGYEGVVRLFLESGRAVPWAARGADGLSPVQIALDAKNTPLVKAFFFGPSSGGLGLQFSKEGAPELCRGLVGVMGLDLDVRAVVAKFPAGKLNVVLAVAKLFQETASEDEQATLGDRLKELEGMAVELLDRMEAAFSERLQRRRYERSETGPWFTAVKRAFNKIESASDRGEGLDAEIEACLAQTPHDARDSWLVKTTLATCDRERLASLKDAGMPIRDAVEVLEACLGGQASALDMALDLGFTSVVGHRFVQRYVNRIWEGGPPLSVMSVLPASLAAALPWGPTLWTGVQCSFCKVSPIIGTRFRCMECSTEICADCRAAGFHSSHELDKMEKPKAKPSTSDREADSKESQRSAATGTETGQLWYEWRTNALGGWRGRLAMELGAFLLFLALLGAVVFRGGGWLLAPLALQTLGLIVYEVSQLLDERRSGGVAAYFSNVFTWIDWAVLTISYSPPPPPPPAACPSPLASVHAAAPDSVCCARPHVALAASACALCAEALNLQGALRTAPIPVLSVGPRSAFVLLARRTHCALM